MMQAQGAVPCTTLLGKGRFGKVYQVGTSDGLVVKRTKTDASSLCETTTLQQLQGLGGDVIIAFYGHCVIRDETFIFMERCSGSLEGRSFGETEAACLVRQLFRALQHVHLMRFLHRDVKPANCLVKAWAGAVAFWEVRLSDFGCSCGFSSAATVPPAGTLAFWSPELVAGEAPAASADIWAGATTAWALATGTMPPSVATLHSLKYPEVSQWPGSDAFGPLFLAWLEATLAVTGRASATKALHLDWLQEAHTLLPPAPAPPVATFQPKNESNSKFLRRVAPQRTLQFLSGKVSSNNCRYQLLITFANQNF